MRSSNKNLNGRRLRLWMVVFASFFASATTIGAEFSSHPMRFGHLTINDGLSQSNVLSILQDSDGMMWFGTENGLNSFDGYEVDHYKRERGNPNALSNDFIFDIAEAKAGILWVATNGGGLAKLDRATGLVTNFRHDANDAESIAGNIVRRLLIDDAGYIWLGMRGAGLDRFDPATETFRHFSLSADDTSNTTFALLLDSTGTLWVGGDHGLTRFDTDSFASETMVTDAANPASISPESVRAVAETADGQLWVGTYGGGLSRFERNSNTFEHFVHDADDPTTISSDRVSSIFEDSDSRLWAGTAEGLNLIDRSTGAVIRYASDRTDSSSLGGDDISTIYEDRTGLLWVGTRSHGVNTWNPRTWYYGFEDASEITSDGESQPNVMAFIDDNAGTLWVGTFGEGLNAINRQSGEIQKYRNDPTSELQIPDDYVMSLMRDSKGSIWIGTMRAGIALLNPTTGEITQFQHEKGNPDSLAADGIMTIYEARDGSVWAGTFGGGISRYNPKSGAFENFAADAEDRFAVSSNRITSFAEDKVGNMWVGTDGGGLNLMDRDTERFYQFSHDPDDRHTLASATVYSINIDAGGTVWVGTQGGGLDRVVGSAEDPATISFLNTSTNDGLANDVIYGVQFDDAGRIWMSTNFGISRFNPDSGKIKNMHRKDGLQSEEFNFGAHYRSDSGELFFGGHSGFNAFHPKEIKASAVVPLIALTGFFNGGDATKADLPMDEAETVEISWQDDVIAFEFAAMDFVAPDQNRYMYKLEGFDEEWIDLGNRRRVTYTDLNDGNYLLRVRAANSEGVWNEAGFALPVRVSAAPWDTWWAYLGYVAVFAQLAASLWLGHRRKIRREEEYSHRLEQEVQSRTEKLLGKNEQLQELNLALQESSLSDPLTGLRNRRFVFEEVSRDLDVMQRRLDDERDGVDKNEISEMVFMMIDVDNFKPINDTYGHAAGDQMLLQLRDVLLGMCRRSDFVIRWGGDEFVVIAKQTRPEEAEQLAERIRSSVADSNFTLSDGQIVRTTCSIGFAAYPLFRAKADESNLDQIISLADGLMYEAKKKRNAWVGMLGPSEATASFDIEHDTIESTSLLFGARRAGKLKTFSSYSDEQRAPMRLESAG